MSPLINSATFFLFSFFSTSIVHTLLMKKKRKKLAQPEHAGSMNPNLFFDTFVDQSIALFDFLSHEYVNTVNLLNSNNGL